MTTRNQALTPLFEKKHELELAINALVSKREIAERVTKEASEAATDLQDRVKALEKAIEETTGLGLEAITQAKEALRQASEALHLCESCMAMTKEVLSKLDTAIAERTTELEKINEQAKIKLKEIADGNVRMDIDRRDLEIYKRRLQKKADELGYGPLLFLE